MNTYAANSKMYTNTKLMILQAGMVDILLNTDAGSGGNKKGQNQKMRCCPFK